MIDVPDKSSRALDFDALSILHDAIDRLPVSLRLPVVLCDLQGLTYEQAAGQLHLSAAALSHRLARGRKSLRERLVRRGVTCAAAAAAIELAQTSATAAVPACWEQAAVAAATGDAVPAAVATLTHAMIRSLLLTRLKLASMAVLAMAALLAAGIVTAAARHDSHKPPPPAPAGTATADEPTPATATKTQPGTLAIEARDLLTDAPVPDVRLEFSAGSGSSKIPATTDASGAARFSRPVGMRYFYVRAAREGFVPLAFRWDYDPASPTPPDRLLFQMEQATAISGRVVDQDQKPLAGETVVVKVSKRYPRSRQWVDLTYESTETNADGLWSFSSVPANPDSIELAAYHYLCLRLEPHYYVEEFNPRAALRDGSATCACGAVLPSKVRLSLPTESRWQTPKSSTEIPDAWPTRFLHSRPTPTVGFPSASRRGLSRN